jgi:hypothetical protein
MFQSAYHNMWGFVVCKLSTFDTGAQVHLSYNNMAVSGADPRRDHVNQAPQILFRMRLIHSSLS